MKSLLPLLFLVYWGEFSGPRLPPEAEKISFNWERLDEEKEAIGDSIKVIFENKRESLFSFKDLSFRLKHPAIFHPLKNEDVPWINPENFTDQNGTFIIYQKEGANKRISEPYIMLQYISREMENCASIDEIYNWLDNFFLGEKSRGRVLGELFPFQTTSGMNAYCKEYYSPTNTPRLPDKRIAYAYFVYDEQYLIGMNLTTYNDKDFKKLKKAFYKIVKSFRKIP